MSVAQVRAALEQHGLAAQQQPEDGAIEALLAVEDGSVHAVSRAILDGHAEERRRDSGDSRRSAEERSAAHTARDPAPDANELSRPNGPMVERGVAGWLRLLWRFVSVPFSLVQTVVLFCLRALRLAQPRYGGAGGAGDSFEMSRFAQDPRASARRFVDELEKDTNGTTGELHGPEDMRVRLPVFQRASYSDALQQAKREINILAVFLTSHVHADDAVFRSRVLTDSALVETLRSGEFVVWGGDVRDRETHRVSTLLEASTFPFVAFIALQPSRRPGGSPRAAVLSRLEGSPQSVISASSLVAHILEVLLPRSRVILDRQRAEREHREQERQLRADQDRAFEQASLQDMDRVLRRRAEAERASREERERAQREAATAAAASAAQERLTAWKRWAHAHLVPADAGSTPGAVRLSVHLPDGRNLQRRFAPSATLEQVYAYVATVDVPNDGAEAPAAPPADYLHEYSFQLVQTYPRRALDKSALQMPLSEIDALAPSANLVVEGPMGEESSEEEA